MLIRKILSMSVALLTVILFLPVTCFSSTSEITSISQLNSPRYKVGTDGGGPVLDRVRENLPDAEILKFNEFLDQYLALQNEKIDAITCNEPEIISAIRNGLDNVRILPGSLGKPIPTAAGISGHSHIPGLKEKFNAFIAGLKADGTLQAMYKRWVYDNDTNMPMIDVPERSDIHLTVGTTGLVMPFSFYINSDVTGFDIELARRFAAHIGAELEIRMYGFGSILMALKSGSIDLALSNLYVTPETEESVNFSDIIFNLNCLVLVRDKMKSSAPEKNQERIPKYKTFSELDGKPIGMQPGIIDWENWVAENLPRSKIQYYNTYPDLASALKTHKIEGFLVDSPVLALMAAEDHELTSMVDPIGKPFGYSFCYAKTEAGKKLSDEMSEYIRKIKASGELDAIISKWQGANEDEKIPPDFKNLPAKNGTIIYTTEGSYPPFSYYKGENLAGIDIDIVVKFCEAYGYGLNVQVMLFDAMLPAIFSGKVDFAGDFTPSEEHKEAVYFSESYCDANSVMACLKAEASVFQSVNMNLSDFSGKKIGVPSSTNNAAIVEERIPDAKLVYIDSLTDMLIALKQGKIDAISCSKPTANFLLTENDGLAYVSEPLKESNHSVTFTSSEKGHKLRDEYGEFLKTLQDNGTMQKLFDKWIIYNDESTEGEDYSKLPATKGTLKMAVDTGMVPFVYVKDNKIQGYDIDLAAMFCKAEGYGLEIVPISRSGVLEAVRSGKCDFSFAMIYTEERAKSVLFSKVPNIEADNLLVILNPSKISQSESQSLSQNEPSFLQDITLSFRKTFIREKRWKLFAEGILNTMIITMSSIFCGILLGFSAFMFCRTGSKIANIITKFSVWLIKGTPIVVLLMILYYIIFGSVNISGIIVSIIAFTLTFGTSVYRMLTFGTGAVDKGQTEAAYALGFTDLQTFFTVILPQAALHFMPSLKEEVTMLIKSTSVVGYIAVQDLTKMGDIVRSRTYEAFFPLIAVAVIYFVLAGMLNIIVNIIHVKITPSKREPKNILRGINTTRESENYD